jgi:hypothetical protein
VISFRYHLISIVGVFLALALGIVIGTTALNGPITKDLRRQVDAARAQRANLAGQVKVLHSQVGDAGQFAATYGTQLVGGTLSGKTVVVVELPGTTSAMQNGVDTLLSAAGAKIGGRLSVSSEYLDPSRGGGITSLATGPAHPVGLTLPETSNAGQLGGALLAYVLLGKGQQTDLSQVLGGFAELHMLTVEGSSTVTPGSSVVVLAGGSQAGNSYRSATELALVNALAKAGGSVVVAGNPASASSGGLVADVRHTGSTRDMVSTVDDANNPLGQVSAVLALSAESSHQFGQYGTQNGADALFPPPAR